MAKDKQSSEKPTAKKTAAKKSPAKKAATKKSAAVIASTVPPVTPALTVKTKAPSAADLYEEIRRRAYEFYNERGGQHGSHEADWHRAEAEVRAKYKS